MKRIHILESQLIKEEENIAGTDHPCFYDEKNDVSYAADWDSDFGFPFGFWNDGEGYEFSIGDAWSTHINACGKVARKYYYNVRYEMLLEDCGVFVDKLDDLISLIYDEGYTYDDDENVYVSSDGFDTIDIYEWVDENSYIPNNDKALKIVKNAIDNHESPCAEDIADEIASEEAKEYNFENDKEELNSALEEIGDSFDTYFENGYYEGRIWPNCEMIGFYSEQQPEPNGLDDIVRRLANANIDTYQNILDYTIVFENWLNGEGEVTACTVSDYIRENYGYDDEYDEDEEYDEDDEGEKQYARQGDTKFVPHLANQQQKREFFKDFRNTRDKAVYAPRERAAGSLAAYHAMRYPYGENRRRKKNVIR